MMVGIGIGEGIIEKIIVCKKIRKRKELGNEIGIKWIMMNDLERDIK